MSLIRRRKSPGWKFSSIKPNASRVSKSVGSSKTIKIVNPISGNKINLNGPTHKRLIKEKVLDAKGLDIRSKSKTQKSKTRSKTPITKPRLYGDVVGNIMRFLPEKEMVKVSKLEKKYPERSLLSYPFDLDSEKRCQAFLDSDFDILMKNQNLDRLGLFQCIIKRGLVDKVKILLKDRRVDPRSEDNKAIRIASQNGHLGVVKELLKDSRVDPSAEDNKAIQMASENGHLKVVKELLKDSRVDPGGDNNWAIHFASENGHLGVVKELLKDPRVDPRDADAIVWASNNGHTLVVRELLKDSRVDPSGGSNYVIRIASQNGHLSLVKELLKDERVDPSADDNQAIEKASKNGHLEVVKLLLKDERVYNSLSKHLKNKYEKELLKITKIDLNR